jgi:hypothetical protein
VSEADLYHPVKRFLEEQGYAVKGEIGACDVVAVRADEEPVIVELKRGLSLALILQAVDRQRVSDTVYVAFRVGNGHSATWRAKHKWVKSLLRRLGLGLLTVSPDDRVHPVLDPAPYRPRPDRRRRARLLKEFAERVGDPEAGGSASRRRLTAYRQDALRCATVLEQEGVMALRALREVTDVARAGPIVRDNHYGWFERVKRGHYRLTPKGRSELPEWADAIERIVPEA